MRSVVDRNVVMRSIPVFPPVNTTRIVVAVETVVVCYKVETESWNIIHVSFVFYTSVAPVSIIPPMIHTFHQRNTILIENTNGRSLGTLKNAIIFKRDFFLCFLWLIHYYLVPRTDSAGRKDLQWYILLFFKARIWFLHTGIQRFLQTNYFVCVSQATEVQRSVIENLPRQYQRKFRTICRCICTHHCGHTFFLPWI